MFFRKDLFLFLLNSNQEYFTITLLEYLVIHMVLQFFYSLGFTSFERHIIKDWVQSPNHCFVLDIFRQIVVMGLSVSGPPYFKSFAGMLSMPGLSPVLSGCIASLTDCNAIASPNSV